MSEPSSGDSVTALGSLSLNPDLLPENFNSEGKSPIIKMFSLNMDNKSLLVISCVIKAPNFFTFFSLLMKNFLGTHLSCVLC